MKVKKYIVDSIPQAMNQIKKDLGNDAVIIQTRKIKDGGFLGLFAKQKIELIAAADTDTIKTKKPSEKLENKNNNEKREVFINDTKNTAIYNKNLDNSSVANEMKSADSIKNDVSELKNLVLKMMVNHQSENADSFYSKDVKSVYDALLKQGVNEKITSSIIEQVVNSAGDDISNINVCQETKKQIIEMFKSNKCKSEIEKETRIVNFVGPTGVGKTTTIAKLAADIVLKHNKRVAFITSDTYRIGAVDQLKTYADIFNSPIEVVFSPLDTQKAVEKFSSYDLIFMDTAGRNYNNNMYISELSKLLAKDIKTETYLVLSLTSKYEDLVLILEQFKKIKIDKILFTKMDETYTYGSILNIIYTYPYKVSYITYGQNVPDDIKPFDINEIANAVFGGIE